MINGFVLAYASTPPPTLPCTHTTRFRFRAYVLYERPHIGLNTAYKTKNDATILADLNNKV